MFKHKENTEITRQIEKSLTDIYRRDLFIVKKAKSTKSKDMTKFIKFINGETDEIDRNAFKNIAFEVRSLKYEYYNYCMIGDYLVKLLRDDKNKELLIAFSGKDYGYDYYIHSIFRFKHSNIDKLKLLGINITPELLGKMIIDSKLSKVFSRID